MTPEQLEEIPGIGEKTLEKISVAVRHYFGQYEEGEERPVVAVPEPTETARDCVEGPKRARGQVAGGDSGGGGEHGGQGRGSWRCIGRGDCGRGGSRIPRAMR